MKTEIKKPEEKKSYSRDDVYKSPAMRWWTVMIWLVLGAIGLISIQIYGAVKKYQRWHAENTECFSGVQRHKCLDWDK